MSTNNDLFANTIAGGFAGMCTVLVGHSFDTMKVRLQTLSPTETSLNMFKLTYVTFKKIIKNEGFLGLYKGVTPSLLESIPNYALFFYLYNFAKNAQTSSLPDQKLNSSQIYFATTFSSFCCLPITIPMERAKCLLQVQQNSKGMNLYNGMFDCFLKVYKSQGIKGLYKGGVLTFYRDVPCAVGFVIYENLKEFLKKDDNEKLSPLKAIFAGGITGMIGYFVCLPFDTMKSCYQTAPEGKYNSVMSVYKDLTRQAGFKILYRGAVPIMVKSFPTYGACFFGYELAMYGLNSLRGYN